ncbi:MAG: hypothetical protein J0I25_03150 [Sphingomonadales bacterium]|nr:hypothetical protein [Sphingomonadales bacterium]
MRGTLAAAIGLPTTPVAEKAVNLREINENFWAIITVSVKECKSRGGNRKPDSRV